MKRSMLTCFATLSLLLVMAGAVATPTLAKPGGNAVASAACAGEGYRNYTDATRTGFKNEGQCTAYAAQGNALVPRKSAVLTFVASSTDGYCLPVLTVSGYEPGTWLVTFQPSTGSTRSIEVDVNGNGSVVGSEIYNLIQEGTIGHANFRGLRVATATADC